MVELALVNEVEVNNLYIEEEKGSQRGKNGNQSKRVQIGEGR